MIDFFQAIALGALQGVTEWLPVSSSGHLVILQSLFGIEPPLIFDVLLHLGSLVVIFILFWKDIADIGIGVLKRKREELMLLAKLVLATIPIGIVGIVFNDLIESMFHNTLYVGIALLFTSAILFFSKMAKGNKDEMTWKSASLMGIAQAFAIIPGISRSGSTISIGMLSGVSRERAARMSFLMAIPPILGAALLEIEDLPSLGDPLPMLAGFLASVLVGFFSLKLLLKIIREDRFHLFGWYSLVLGLATILFSLV